MLSLNALVSRAPVAEKARVKARSSVALLSQNGNVSSSGRGALPLPLQSVTVGDVCLSLFLKVLNIVSLP